MFEVVLIFLVLIAMINFIGNTNGNYTNACVALLLIVAMLWGNKHGYGDCKNDFATGKLKLQSVQQKMDVVETNRPVEIVEQK